MAPLLRVTSCQPSASGPDGALGQPESKRRCRTAEEGHAGRRFSLEGHATFGAFPFLMTGSFSSSDEEEEEL
jgi:hypothetical protein